MAAAAVVVAQDLGAPVDKFAALPLSEETKKGLRAAGFTKLTDIQRSSIPRGLKGRDVRGRPGRGRGDGPTDGGTYGRRRRGRSWARR